MPGVALIVDDSMVIRHTVSRFLEERGYAVEAASNGMEALEILKRIPAAPNRKPSHRHPDGPLQRLRQFREPGRVHHL